MSDSSDEEDPLSALLSQAALDPLIAPSLSTLRPPPRPQPETELPLPPSPSPSHCSLNAASPPLPTSVPHSHFPSLPPTTSPQLSSALQPSICTALRSPSPPPPPVHPMQQARREAAQQALHLNRQLQRACEAQLQSIKRAMQRNKAMRDRATQAAAELQAMQQGGEAMQPAGGTALIAASDSGAALANTRPSLHHPQMEGGHAHLNPDALARRALCQAVPLRPPSEKTSRSWSREARKDLRQGVIATLLSQANQRINRQSHTERQTVEREELNTTSSLLTGEAVEPEERERAQAALARLEREGQIDWLALRNVHLPHRTPEDCEAQWAQCDSALVRPFLPQRADPMGKSVPFSEEERAALRELALCYQGHQWEEVASQMAERGFEGRTAMGCMRYYKSVIKREEGAVRTGPGRKWTPSEDEQLKASVGEFGSTDWTAVASRVVGRSHQECLQRWRYVLDPAIKKGPWTQEEDAKLRELVSVHGARLWSTWAPQAMGGRTEMACRERWVNRLDPNRKCGTPWSKQEEIVSATRNWYFLFTEECPTDVVPYFPWPSCCLLASQLALLEGVSVHGAGAWSAIVRHSSELRGRTDDDARSRYKRMLRHVASHDLLRLQSEPEEMHQVIEAGRKKALTLRDQSKPRERGTLLLGPPQAGNENKRKRNSVQVKVHLSLCVQSGRVVCDVSLPSEGPTPLTLHQPSRERPRGLRRSSVLRATSRLDDVWEAVPTVDFNGRADSVRWSVVALRLSGQRLPLPLNARRTLPRVSAPGVGHERGAVVVMTSKRRASKATPPPLEAALAVAPEVEPPVQRTRSGRVVRSTFEHFAEQGFDGIRRESVVVVEPSTKKPRRARSQSFRQRGRSRELSKDDQDVAESLLSVAASFATSCSSTSVDLGSIESRHFATTGVVHKGTPNSFVYGNADF